MFVSTGARKLIGEKRRRSFYDNFVRALLEEAGKLGISREEVIAMIERSKTDEGH